MIKLFNTFINLSNEKIYGHIHKWLYNFIVINLIATIAISLYSYFKHHHWIIGDWLVNYQAGMIRRGLLGELFYILYDVTGVNPAVFVVFVQIACYSLFFLMSYKLIKLENNIVPYLLLIISPFIFTFQIYDMAGGLRKEILFFPILAFMVYAANVYDSSRFKTYFYVVILCFPVLILTHEILAVYLPYVIIVYFYGRDVIRKELILVSVLLVPSILSLAAVMVFSGTPEQVTMIFESINNSGYAISGGAIESLGKSIDNGFAMVVDCISNEHYLLYHLHMIVLAALAYIPIRRRLQVILKQKIALFLITTSVIGTIALCIVAIDWGRFIYIHLVSLFLISFLFRKNQTNISVDPLHDIQMLKDYCHSKFNMYAVACGLLFYSQLWHIEHSGSTGMYSQINAFLYIQSFVRFLGKLLF